MDITMIGLQNAGKTSLLRVLAVRDIQTCQTFCALADTSPQGGEFTIEYANLEILRKYDLLTILPAQYLP